METYFSCALCCWGNFPDLPFAQSTKVNFKSTHGKKVRCSETSLFLDVHLIVRVWLENNSEQNSKFWTTKKLASSSAEREKEFPGAIY